MIFRVEAPHPVTNSRPKASKGLVLKRGELEKSTNACAKKGQTGLCTPQSSLGLGASIL